jgi:hypothetical protein
MNRLFDADAGGSDRRAGKMLILSLLKHAVEGGPVWGHAAEARAISASVFKMLGRRIEGCRGSQLRVPNFGDSLLWSEALDG